MKIFGGLGGLFFLEELLRGASGTMTGFAFTEILVQIYDLYNSKKTDEAKKKYKKCANQAVNVIHNLVLLDEKKI